MRLLPFLLILLLSLTGCKPEPDAVRIGGNRWPGYGPYYLADEQGLLARDHIKLIEYPHATGVMRAFENGLLDAAFLTLDEALRLAAEGLDIEIVLVADVSAGADALYSKAHINRLEQLAGQRIGVENTALGGYFLSRILDRAGLDESKVSIVNLPVNEHARALAEDRIDAVVSFASEEQKLLASGAHRLFDSRELPNAIIDVLVVSRQHTRAADRQRLHDLWYEGLQYWQQQDEDATRLLSTRLGLQPAELKLVTSQLLLGDRHLNLQLRQDGILQREVAQIEAYLLERRLILQLPHKSLLAECREPQC